MNSKETINSRIRYYMHQKNMTIAEFARAMNITHQRASDLIYAKKIKKNYTMDTIEQLAEAFDIPLFDMLTPLPIDIDIGLLEIPRGRRKQKKI